MVFFIKAGKELTLSVFPGERLSTSGLRRRLLWVTGTSAAAANGDLKTNPLHPKEWHVFKDA